MVSPELQASLMSIKGCTATALEGAAARNASPTAQFFRLLDKQTGLADRGPPGRRADRAGLVVAPSLRTWWC